MSSDYAFRNIITGKKTCEAASATAPLTGTATGTEPTCEVLRIKAGSANTGYTYFGVGTPTGSYYPLGANQEVTLSVPIAGGFGEPTQEIRIANIMVWSATATNILYWCAEK